MQNKKSFFFKIFLFPFSIGYKFIVFWRNFFYDNGIFQSKEFDIPVISVGNIIVGGTGKTPHSEMIVGLLKEQFKIAVLSRGYKRKSKGFIEVQTTSSYVEVGDEPLQIKRKFSDIIVAVSRNRVKGIERLMALYPELNVIILDDAFQHRRVKPGISILLNSFHIPLSSAFLLPYGSLREHRSAVQRADLIVVTKCPEDMKPIERRIMLKEMEPKPYQTLFFSTFEYLTPKTVFDSFAGSIEKYNLKEYNVLVVTGIAYSDNFINYLKNNTKSLKHLKFSDHHNFNKLDIHKIDRVFGSIEDEKIILTTEKDAIRFFENLYLSDELKSKLFYVPIEVKMMGGNEDVQQLKSILISYVSTNKRYNKLYKNTNIN